MICLLFKKYTVVGEIKKHKTSKLYFIKNNCIILGGNLSFIFFSLKSIWNLRPIIKYEFFVWVRVHKIRENRRRIRFFSKIFNRKLLPHSIKVIIFCRNIVPKMSNSEIIIFLWNQKICSYPARKLRIFIIIFLTKLEFSVTEIDTLRRNTIFIIYYFFFCIHRKRLFWQSEDTKRTTEQPISEPHTHEFRNKKNII